MAKTFVVKTRGSNLNVRSGPGTNYESVGKLRNGAQVSVVETQGQWMKTSTGGWVHADYLDDKGSSTPSASPVGGPPDKNSRPTPDNLRKLNVWLTSLVAGHAGATNTYTFYEEIDKYLGPWGESGYPIGYGKKYNVLFTQNKKLKSDPVVSDWVWKTGILLQEYLRDFILERYRAGTLSSLTEPELRKAAFDSHPKAYTKGGLTLVVITAPELLSEIKNIPKAEFDESSPNYEASKKQVWETIGIVAPEAVGIGLATLAGPAHTGVFRRAMDRDRLEFQQRINQGRWLGETKKAIVAGEVDRVQWLLQIIARIKATQFPDQAMATEARKVVQAAQTRICVVAHRYQDDIKNGKETREVIDRLDPGWSDIVCRFD